MTLDFLASSNLPTVTIINCLSLQHPHDPTLDLAVEKIDKLTSNVAEKMKQLDERSESLQTELTKVKQVLKRTIYIYIYIYIYIFIYIYIYIYI